MTKGQYTRAEINQQIATAVEAERERCAMIVEAFQQANERTQKRTLVSEERSMAIQTVCLAIAGVIRGEMK